MNLSLPDNTDDANLFTFRQRRSTSQFSGKLSGFSMHIVLHVFWSEKKVFRLPGEDLPAHGLGDRIKKRSCAIEALYS